MLKIEHLLHTKLLFEISNLLYLTHSSYFFLNVFSHFGAWFPKESPWRHKKALKIHHHIVNIFKKTLAFCIFAVSARTKLPSYLWQLYSHSFVFSASLLQSSILFFKFSISVSMLSISWCSPRTSLTTSLSPASKVPIVEEISLSSKLSSHCWTMCWNSLRFVMILVSDDAILSRRHKTKLTHLVFKSNDWEGQMKLSTTHVVLCYRVTSGQRSSGQVQNCYLDHCGLNLQSVVAFPFKNDFSHYTFCF